MITLTQLEYVVAVDTYRHFGKAAENCFITQPTLSMQLKKLEEDLEIIIFDRSKQPLIPTDVGQKIIEQARITLKQADEINNIIKEHKNQVSGLLRIGIIPTLAPYLLPIFIGKYKKKYPNIFIKVVEQTTENIVKLLHKDLIDVGILVTPLKEEKINEKPIFYEEMLIYANTGHKLHKQKEITVADIATPEIWLLSDGHCFRDQVINLCSFLGTTDSELPFHFEAGSLETLMNIIDREGGITLIPELAKDGMSDKRLNNIRSFSNMKPLREVSLVYSRHFAKHKLINLLWREIKEVIPVELQDEKRGSIVEWK
ncbi:MAG: hydrogen peroxide-inducible genes activator [Prolixibacteraceae bacterium]|jgi:LysR family transcriptional regulator, hydrogen peroxide-inducible genes activator|nr:hydrogen peroxide-inducible genes activator [Prolixibacteraceae bacterium]MBT6004593.1 hydrogen peroxide-inducible genes activator [Prolixibacteraceae bacterium]MBT6763717.1 hydrogen peroxide-inducible genes activator [Prolixibacteraceae bacterium]MBT7000035.1 hydrogen peroxide-inducible genes activator [Prolixibacteraceae bacterium]MBT7394824.1 hydrogen peroxide-inducible genes activator [Prolixibacteraceae bacterium]